MLRIFLGGAMSNLGSTKIFVDKSQWNNNTSRQKGRSSEALAVNASLDAISTNLHNIYRKYEDDESISLDKLRAAYLGQAKEYTSFLPVFDKFIDDIRQRVGHTISKDSLQKYSVLRKHFANFLLHKYKRKDLGLTEFTPAIVQDFELYLTTHVSCVRMFCRIHINVMFGCFAFLSPSHQMSDEPSSLSSQYLKTSFKHRLIFKNDDIQFLSCSRQYLVQHLLLRVILIICY